MAFDLMSQPASMSGLRSSSKETPKNSSLHQGREEGVAEKTPLRSFLSVREKSDHVEKPDLKKQKQIHVRQRRKDVTAAEEICQNTFLKRNGNTCLRTF